MREIYSYFQFKILKSSDKEWAYELYTDDDGVITSDENYDSEQEARFAVIGHITLIEKGDFK
jgi:uncharacterized protein YegP (UPF0339 family)